MKIALVCSAGGHLTEMRSLEAAYKQFPHFFVTFRRADSSELADAHFVTDPKRSPLAALRNVVEALALFLRERPDVVITTGAGVAIPFCLIAKLFGKKLVVLESFCRVERPSATGKILYPVADLFLVQWEELLKSYGPKARCWGRLL